MTQLFSALIHCLLPCQLPSPPPPGPTGMAWHAQTIKSMTRLVLCCSSYQVVLPSVILLLADQSGPVDSRAAPESASLSHRPVADPGLGGVHGSPRLSIPTSVQPKCVIYRVINPAALIVKWRPWRTAWHRRRAPRPARVLVQTSVIK